MLHEAAILPAFLGVNAIIVFGAFSSLVIFKSGRMTAPFFCEQLG